MSRSNPTSDSSHPCKLWLEWKGGPGVLSYWDKDKKGPDGTDGCRVEVDVSKKPFRAIMLAQTCTVRGYSKVAKSGVLANEIPDRATGTHRLTVRLFNDKNPVASGLWADIRDVVTSKRINGSFAKNVYIAYKDGDKLSIGCIQISGCALGPWIEFQKASGKALKKQGFSIGRGVKNDEGEIEFYPPIFGIVPITPESHAKAVELDVELQTHLKEYYAKTTELVHPPATVAAPARQSRPEPAQDEPPVDPNFEPDLPTADPDQDVPF